MEKLQELKQQYANLCALLGEELSLFEARKVQHDETVLNLLKQIKDVNAKHQAIEEAQAAAKAEEEKKEQPTEATNGKEG